MKASKVILVLVGIILLCVLFLAFSVKRGQADSGSPPPDPNRSITGGYTNERFKPDPRCDPRVSAYCKSERRLGIDQSYRLRIYPKPAESIGRFPFPGVTKFQRYYMYLHLGPGVVSPESAIKYQMRNPPRFDPEITFKSGWKKLIPRSVRKAMRPAVP